MYSTADRVDSLFMITDELEVAYDLSNPVKTYEMPGRLIEISGISYVDEHYLICIEDETGHLYHFNLQSGKVDEDWRFRDEGDYEDVAFVDDTVYVLESDGDIYKFHFSKAGAHESLKYETRLSTKNDTEGLCFNPLSKCLLIACKEESDLKGKDINGTAIYSFSLSDHQLKPKPFYTVTSNALKSFFEQHRTYTYDVERIRVQPSGIAYNPLDGYFYVLASVGKMIIVIDDKKNIKGTYSIPGELFEQPEGITFSRSGDLWISTEGGKGPGKILAFKPNRKEE